MSNEKKWIIGGVAAVLIACMCIGVACVALGGLAFLRVQSSPEGSTPPIQFPGAATEIPDPFSSIATPAGEDGFNVPTVVPDQPEDPASALAAQETLLTLENMVVPINDPRDLARRLEGKLNIPETVPAPSVPLTVGAKRTFFAANVDTNANFEVQATLQYVTDHLYFWIQDGVSYDARALQRLCETFETKIYPTNREFFGSEWTPGIDNDPHLYVLFARGVGNNLAGYFSSADEIPPQAHPYSNAAEMFLMNADTLDLGDPYIYGTMTHEFQHMIHWYRDRNEESWLNEGFSVLAEFLNNYDVGGFDYLYVSDPDLQLNVWPAPPNSTPHYGASFLFLAYFLDRFGETATQTLVASPENGMDSIDKVLSSINAVDQQTGKAIQADDVFADWVVASYLNDQDVGDGRFAYKRYTSAPSPEATEEVDNCSSDWKNRTVSQFGVDYIKINCSDTYTLNFQGLTEVGVLPAGANSGQYAFWSNKGDESNMTLTKEFDFTDVSGPLTLKYSTWYDLEVDYDYLYLVASEDGETWQILKTPSGRDKSEDPSGNAYGWGYNGQSDDWIEESVDISQFAGKKVTLRFEYVTDAAVNGEGLLLDDVQIPEIAESTDFETDDGGWDGNGFVRIQNLLPQTFRLSLIEDGQTVSVQNIQLDESQKASISLKLDENTRGAVLVVSGTARFTTREAGYRFNFER